MNVCRYSFFFCYVSFAVYVVPMATPIFSPDSKAIIRYTDLGLCGKFIDTIDVKTMETIKSFRVKNGVNFLVFSSIDPHLLFALGGYDLHGSFAIWDTQANQRVGAGVEPDTLGLYEYGIFDTKGRLACTTTHSGRIQLFDINQNSSGEEYSAQCSKIFVGLEYPVNDIAFNDDETLLFGVSLDEIRSWNVQTGECVKQYEHPESMGKTVFGLKARMLVASYYKSLKSECIKVWNLKSGSVDEALRFQVSDTISDVALNPFGDMLAYALYNNSIQIRALPHGNLLYTFQEDFLPFSITFSDDGNWLVAKVGRTIKRIDLCEINSDFHRLRNLTVEPAVMIAQQAKELQ